MNASSRSPALGLGLYPLADAAQLTQLDLRTAHRWAEGYRFKYRGEQRQSPPVVSPTLPAVGTQSELTFAEMLTLRLVKGFRGAGLSLRTIKRVAAVAARDMGTSTPFVSQRFRTDGRKVFLELRQTKPANDEPSLAKRDRELVEVLTGQRAFTDVVEPSLFRNLEWDDEIATRWWPLGRNRSVVLDPTTMFGAPRIDNTRVLTTSVAAAVRAWGSDAGVAARVADWQGITSEQVRDAVEFETVWLRQAG